MPLPPPNSRQLLHQRDITIQGFIRDDGLYDIEARLNDTKSYDFANRDRGIIKKGEPLHLMYIRLTIDSNLTIQDVAVTTDAAPFHTCPYVTPAFNQLKQVTIGPGWTRKIKSLFAGINGCTHINEALLQMATIAYQTMHSKKNSQSPNPNLVNFLENSCFSYGSDKPAMRYLREDNLSK